jgi:hypothetical protein
MGGVTQDVTRWVSMRFWAHVGEGLELRAAACAGTWIETLQQQAEVPRVTTRTRQAVRRS